MKSLAALLALLICTTGLARADQRFSSVSMTQLPGVPAVGSGGGVQYTLLETKPNKSYVFYTVGAFFNGTSIGNGIRPAVGVSLNINLAFLSAGFGYAFPIGGRKPALVFILGSSI